jgi:radical SAM protein (TIGR01212 family)
MQTCNFCDQWGSAAYAQNLQEPLNKQIDMVRRILIEKRGIKKFMIYFQAYTTTFAKVSRLAGQIETALAYDDVVGVTIGTRPDCLSQAFFDLCESTAQKTFVAVEVGVQSFDNKILKWMRRGHTAEQSLKAIELLAAKCPSVNLGVHLIFGSPGESDEAAMDAARRINALPVHNVKLHHMHVLKNTPLADEYARGEFEPLSKEAYFARCTLFLQHLKPEIAVHRLSAFAPRWDELIAPQWTTFKMQTYQEMLTYMRDRGAFQGQYVVSP